MIPDYLLTNPRIVEDIFKLGVLESELSTAVQRELPKGVNQGILDFQTYLEENEIQFPPANRWTGDSQTITYLANQYHVNLKNGILENFFKRQKDFLMVSIILICFNS